MEPKQQAQAAVERERTALIDLSHRIHANPELGFSERNASSWLCQKLASYGYQVEPGICDLPTAFSASLGKGDLTLAICAEYDALPDVGHACGHNVIAAAAVTAACALAPLADELNLKIKVLGTPAEEGGGGKILMMDRGGFDGVDAAMMIHPSPREEAEPVTLAVSHLEVSYRGREAHASSFPHKGINAADALTVAQVAIGLLRQHILPSQRIHGIVTRGGAAPNIVPAHTTAAYYVRAATLAELAQLEPRVRACFEAGALATGCELTVESLSPPYSEFEADREMVELYRNNASSLGRSFAHESDPAAPGSTDMANVSLAVPSIQPMVAIDCGSSGNHQPEFARHCAEPSADRAVIEGGLAMAWTAIDLASSPEQRERLRAERERRGRPSAQSEG